MKPLFQALTHTDDGAFIIDERHEIIFWNQAAESILGFSAEEVAGLQCYEILGGRDAHGNTLCQRFCRIAVSVAHERSLPNLDLYVRTRTGDRIWINLTTFAVPTSNRTFGNVIVHLFRDATQHKSNARFVERVLAASREFENEDEQPDIAAPAAHKWTAPGLDELTPREREVLLLLAHGLGTEQIAGRLTISASTTRNHIQSLLSKLAVHSRLEAVAKAYQLGLIDVGNFHGE